MTQEATKMNWRRFWRYRITHPSCWWRLATSWVPARRRWMQQGRPTRFPTVQWPGRLYRDMTGRWVIEGWGFDMRYTDGPINLGDQRYGEDFVAYLAALYPESLS